MTQADERAQKLLCILSEQRDFMTADDLSRLMNLSQKSIYREIKAINDGNGDSPLILSERGKGYKLDYDRYMQNEHPEARQGLAPKTRQARVMETLLLCSPRSMKVDDLYAGYYVSDSTIQLDERMIAEDLATFQLELIRQNKRLAIVGEEINVRRALLEMIQPIEVMDVESFSLSNRFNKYDALFVSDRLREIEQLMGSPIPYPYNINIFSHLYILIARSRKGQGEEKKRPLTASEKASLEANPSYARIASSIIDLTRKYLHRYLSEREVLYLYHYLISSRLTNEPDPHLVCSAELRGLIQTLTSKMGEKLHQSFNDPKLLSDLVQHIKPLRNRLAHSIHIHNPLLGQIQMAYPKIFHCLVESVQEIDPSYGFEGISADEMGFLALYFARAVETNEKPIRTIVMCTTGVGTSELIRVKVKKKFPELEVVRVVSHSDIDQVIEEVGEVDLILTTIAYHPKRPIQTLMISAMLTPKDCMRIQEIIDERQKGRRTT